jgi:hypothetical protein
MTRSEQPPSIGSGVGAFRYVPSSAAAVSSHMDAELKAHLDRIVETITGIIGEQVAALRRDGEALRRDVDAMRRDVNAIRRDLDALRVEVRDGFIATDERFRTFEQRMDLFETRVNGHFSAISSGLLSSKRPASQRTPGSTFCTRTCVSGSAH